MVKIRTNNILVKNKQGKKGLGLALTYPCAEAIELIGMLGGFDFVNLDGEHGLFSPKAVDEMTRIADGYGLTTIARVANREASSVNLFLDRGIMGIQGPHVETAAEAKALVDACRFAPDGQRSWGGGRGTFYNESVLIDQPGLLRKEFMVNSNNEMLVMCQLESVKAFENLDEILLVDGIDAFAWGTNDLALSMGYPGDPENSTVQKAQNAIGERIHAAGKFLTSDIMEPMSLIETIVDRAKQFLLDNE